MNSLIVLSALLGLAVASPPAIGYGGYDNGYGYDGYGLGGVAVAAPVALGHGVATSYASRIAHAPSVYGVHGGYGGYGARVLSAPIVQSYAPSVLSAHGPAVISRSYASPVVRSYAPSLYSGHGLVGPSVYGGHGIAGPAVYGAGIHGYGAPLVGKVW